MIMSELGVTGLRYRIKYCTKLIKGDAGSLWMEWRVAEGTSDSVLTLRWSFVLV